MKAASAGKPIVNGVPIGSGVPGAGRPPGRGKSPLLRMLAGLAAPSGGEIAFIGQVVSSGTGGVVADPRKHNVGMVIQRRGRA